MISAVTRRTVCGLAACVLVCLLAQPAVAQSGSLVQQAAACLSSQPVCEEPGANPGLTSAEMSALRQRIERRGAGPLYIAILPPQAQGATGGSMDQVLTELANDMHRSGTYVAVADHKLRAFSTGNEPIDGGALATAAVNAHRDQGLDAILTDLVDLVAAARRGALGGGAGGHGGSDGIGAVWIALIAGAVLLLGLAHLRRRRMQQVVEREQVEEVKRTAREDLLALGQDIRALDLDVEMPGVEPAAKDHYNRAVELYDRANQEFEQARRTQDLQRVTAALEEGRFEMATAKAALEGKPAPERRAPCFFDPRHGPSTGDVEWAPPGGVPRPVPACAACRQRVESGVEPDVRQVLVAGQRVPYWSAPSYYGPWAGGFFGGFGGGGFLSGLILGDMLGGGFGGWGGGDDFGGDLGGGNFGGGDIGGGGFGGGDFGGGDFGGGDGGGSF